jgi:hypothetical protein
MEPLARFAWCWLLPALLFLSLSSGKLPTYVLPLFPPLALLAARRWEQIATGVLPWRFGLAISLSALGLVIIASMVVVVLITVRTDDSYLMALDRRLVALFVALAVLFPAASYAGLRANSLRRGFGSLALMAVPVMLLGALFKVSLDRAASTEALAIRLKDLRSPGDVVVCAGEYLPLISFRLGEPICVYGTDADLDFGAAQPGWRSDHLLEVDRLRMLLGGPDRVFLIVREKKRARLLSRIGIDLNVIAQEGKHALLSNAAQLPPPRTNVSPAG